MKAKLILTREERTQAIIDGWRGLPGEFYMLKGLLCLESAVEKCAKARNGTRQECSAERDQFDAIYNSLMIASRMDEIRAEQRVPYAYTYVHIDGKRMWRMASSRLQPESGWTETALFV